MQSDSLAPRQAELLRYFGAQVRNEGRPPTVREMQEHLRLKSPYTVACHLVAIEVKGYLEHVEPGRARGWRLTKLGERFCGFTSKTCPHCGVDTSLPAAEAA